MLYLEMHEYQSKCIPIIKEIIWVGINGVSLSFSTLISEVIIEENFLNAPNKKRWPLEKIVSMYFGNTW